MLFDDERQAFSDLLDDIGEHYGRVVSGSTKLTWWRLLAAQVDLDTLRNLLDRHQLDPERGRFFPQPSDVLALLERRQGGRPGADEAWALALETFDEAATVCLTDEILSAAQAAMPVWAIGDIVGVRLAFKAAYERLVAERRLDGRRPHWQLSLGWDRARRAVAAQRAVESGRLSVEAVRQQLPAILPADADATSGRLTGPVASLPRDEDLSARQRLRALHALLQRGAASVRAPQADRAAATRERHAQRQRQVHDDLERLRARRSGA